MATESLPDYRLHSGSQSPFPNRGSQNFEQYHSAAIAHIQKISTPDGICASEDGVFEGARFTRDETMVKLHMLELYEADMARYGTSPLRTLIENHVASLIDMSTQLVGRVANPDTGEEPGKPPHEFRRTKHAHLTDPTRIAKPWYVNERGEMINYDSVDATSLHVYYIGRLSRAGFLTNPHTQIPTLRLSCEWILDNLARYNGLPAFEYNPHRKYGGLVNMNWCDSHDFVPSEHARSYPRAPIEVAASTWGALRYAEAIYRGADGNFADRLRQAADDLKVRYNDERTGFLVRNPNTGEVSYGYMIADGQKLTYSCINQGYAPFFRYQDGEQVEAITGEHTGAVVRQLVEAGFLKRWGVSMFADGTPASQEGYHRDPNCFWLVAMGTVAIGAAATGFRHESTLMAERMLSIPMGEEDIDSDVGYGEEVAVWDEDLGLLRPWVNRDPGHPERWRRSCADQAWSYSAAAVAVPLKREEFYYPTDLQ